MARTMTHMSLPRPARSPPAGTLHSRSHHGEFLTGIGQRGTLVVRRADGRRTGGGARHRGAGHRACLR
ncbi:hypothetical protein G6F22_021333 [Rhizopus arrhizus]|nr:hypothetical protein G6F22_021333 [Rhizopus arrhizus]KAG1243017.1 hypothetical protein G6F65_022686 [Rhizopus arrhizus]